MNRKILLNLVFIETLCIYQSGMISAQENDVQEKVDNYIEAYIQMNQFSGTILIAKNGHILANKGYGYANYAFNIENTPQTKFRIGSLTKGFTAVAVMQLVEKEKLYLDDKLINYFFYRAIRKLKQQKRI
jgi:CubicO group peptidase (beta-lactamase class C family)